MVENVLFVTGGVYYERAILSWDPLQENWTHVGDLKMPRDFHAAVAIPSNAIECAAMP